MKILTKILILILISSCNKNNKNFLSSNNTKLKQTVKTTNNLIQKINYSQEKSNESTLSIKRIINLITNGKRNQYYKLEKYDKDIFNNYKEYFIDTENNKEFFEKTSMLLLNLKNKLSYLDYGKNIEEKIKKNGVEYICSIEITKKPKKLEYINGNIFGTITCSSEYDSMSRFEEIYLTRIGNSYYILDLFIS